MDNRLKKNTTSGRESRATSDLERRAPEEQSALSFRPLPNYRDSTYAGYLQLTSTTLFTSVCAWDIHLLKPKKCRALKTTE